MVDGANRSLQDLDKDEVIPEPYKLAPVEKVFALQKAESEERKKVEKSRQRKLANLGFEAEHAGEAIL